eukprot:TRINITY_DN14185_c0_g1_i5.p2 TRINITY_DN14185_c0_g1~~TRINITY_DN14185_c0_g1_i5.p2  ORF type:complete len:163 (-),score=16.58 TRINITY_DN14185_c0_g1_i5:2-490(-)
MFQGGVVKRQPTVARPTPLPLVVQPLPDLAFPVPESSVVRRAVDGRRQTVPTDLRYHPASALFRQLPAKFGRGAAARRQLEDRTMSQSTCDRRVPSAPQHDGVQSPVCSRAGFLLAVAGLLQSAVAGSGRITPSMSRNSTGFSGDMLCAHAFAGEGNKVQKL